MTPARRARDPPDQRARRRLLPRARRGASSRRSPSELKWARDAALETVRWVAGFDFPDSRARLRVRRAAAIPTNTRCNEGRIVSNRGLDIAAASTTRISRRARRALERAALAAHASAAPTWSGRWRATPELRRGSRRWRSRRRARPGLGAVCRNPFQSIVVRAVEVLYACDEALRHHRGLRASPTRPAVPVEPRAGDRLRRHRGAARPALSPLPARRGRHDRRRARSCRRPRRTRPSIEEDLAGFVGGWLDLPDDELRHRCEQTVRNYDPCISCATHFLRPRDRPGLSDVAAAPWSSASAIPTAATTPSGAPSPAPSARAPAGETSRSSEARRRGDGAARPSRAGATSPFVVDAALSGAPRRARCTASTSAAAPLPADAVRRRRTPSASACRGDRARARARPAAAALRRLRDRGRGASRLGAPLSPAVAAAAAEAVERVRAEIAATTDRAGASVMHEARADGRPDAPDRRDRRRRRAPARDRASRSGSARSATCRPSISPSISRRPRPARSPRARASTATASDDIDDPHAQSVLLEGIEVET